MTEVTANMIARGSAANADVAAKRRGFGLTFRKAQEAGLACANRDFDLALLKLFANGRQSSALAMAALSVVFAVIALVWAPADAIFIWLSLNLTALGLTHQLARRFLRGPVSNAAAARWRRDFVIAETLQGFSWAIIICLVSQADDPATHACALVMMLLVVAINATITASVPAAAIGALAPMTLAIVALLRPTSFTGGTLPLAALAGGALLYFLLLARKLRAASVETLSFQAEKDALIAELEQSKSNSDLARRRAEEANLAKSRFLATMSHELRTPLNAILGFSEVMKGELFGSHIVASYREYSNDIHSSGQHLLKLINEILDLSRIEAGRFELKEEPVALDHVVEDCRHLLALRAKKRNIMLEEAVEPNLPRIWADERAVRQVTLNLLSNAIKFTPPGGAIKIRIGWTASGGQYVAVRDTGPGIPEEEIPIVMSAFGRGALAQKNAEEGSGLGLPIVKGLVELHGGTFTLKSKLQEGTEVIVIFPPTRVMEPASVIETDFGAARIRRPSRRELHPAA
ncbi:MAG: HAMP domain-containing sensor histidine kinase [Methylocella sp.]